MKGPDQFMKDALKRIFVPHLITLGYSGKYPHFRKKHDGLLHLASVQFWKYGGSFIVEVAKHPAGPKQTSWGELVPEEKIDVAYAPPTERARLQRNGNNGTESGWFRFSQFESDKAKYDALAKEVSSLFAQAEHWLASAEAGPSIHTHGAL